MSGRPTNSSPRALFLTGSCEYPPFASLLASLIILRAFGGAAIVIGLWTYGYNIMRNLGNRITLHSPSRGFSMELGSAITVIMATRLSMLYHRVTPLAIIVLTICRTPCLYHPVYLWCHSRCGSVQRHLENHQLAHDCMDLLWLDYYPPCVWNHFRLSHGNHHQCPSLGIDLLKSSERRLPRLGGGDEIDNTTQRHLCFI